MRRKLLKCQALFKKACFATLLLSFASSGLDAQIITAVGANNGANGTQDDPCPLQDYFKSQRTQYLYTEAELNAAGITAGATINAIGWEVTPTFNNNPNNAATVLEDYSIAIDTTTITSLADTNWETGTVPFYGPIAYNYTAYNTLGPGGYITFPGSFVYNGGNLLVEVCSGQSSGDWTINPACTWTTGLSFNGSHTWKADNSNGCGQANLGPEGDPTTRPRIIIDFTPATACAGAPTAGTVIAPADVCINQPFMLSLSGSTIAAGLTYQWEESPVGLNSWTAVSNGTSSALQTTMSGSMDYRCTLTCGASSASTPAVAVNERAFYVCYCSPLTGSPLSTQYTDNFVTNVEIQTTTLNNSDPNYNNNGYTLFDPSIPGNTATLYPGVSYTITAGVLTSAGLNQAGAWIDFDGDGMMDNTTEFITLSNNGLNVLGTFTVPTTATPGITGLRVRINNDGFTYGGTNQGPCNDDVGGETEDYVITIGTVANCAGIPAHATANGPALACSAIDFSVSAIGMAVGTGVTYDWQYNDGAGWTSTGGANTIYTATGGVLVPTSYRLVTHCGLSNSFDTSNVLVVGIKSFYECYCSPFIGTPLSSQYTDNFITGVDIPNTSLNNTDPTYDLTGYSPFSPSIPSNTTTLFPGVTYILNATAQYSYMADQAGAWIDFDADGAMDNTTEFITLSRVGSIATGTFTVPSTAVPGLTGLRVRMNDDNQTYGGTGQGPCDDDNVGETEDYVITIATLNNCAGQPTHATIIGPNNICPNADFSMNLTGMTVALGASYDWQSNDGTGWVSTGSTGTMLNVSGGITTATSYRVVTTCSVSNLRDTSNVLPITVKTFYQCYCSPLNGTTLSAQGSDNFIINVEIPNTSLANPTSSANGNGYSQFDPPNSNQTTTLNPGFTYTINLNIMNNSGWIMDHCGAWIDFDGDGAFDNTSEFITLTNTGSIVTGTFVVPLTATGGMVGLRIRANDNGDDYGGTDLDACDDDSYGETEDYIITIPTLTNCGGQPAHAIISGPSTSCPNIDFTLTGTSMAVGLGITYDWQSDDGTGWTTTGSASNTHTTSGGISVPTSYRLITHCATSNQFDTSNVLAVSINPFYACYCSPLTGTALSSNYSDNYVSGVNIQGTALNNPTATYNGNGYSQFIPSVVNTTATLLQNGAYTIDVLTNWNYDVGAWIDFDGDGTFDNTTEFIAMVNNANGDTASGTFTIPTTSILGIAGLRIRANNEGFTYGGSNQGPCADDIGGETEDYAITIGATATCPFPTGLSAINITTNSASISWVSTATQHEIEYKAGGIFALGTGNRITATGNPQTISLSPSTMYSYYIRAICGPGDTSLWTAGPSFYSLCGPVSLFPWNDDVEGQPVNYGNGQMSNCWNASPTPSGSDYEWFVGTGYIGSSNSGPIAPHSGGRCFYTEAWNGSLGDIATLTSPEFDITSVPFPHLQFYYHMYGATTGKLVTEIFDGTSWNRVDSLVGQQQVGKTAPWLFRDVALTNFTGVVQVRFEATRGANFTGFISMDDISVVDAPLAIKLDKISATNVGASNRVNWNTLSEEEGDKFELQKSDNGKDFQKLAPVKAKGQASRYTYMDHAPFQGNNYYRLLMTEANGKTTYSDIVKAFVKSSGFSVEAYPNPVSDNLTINVTGVQGNNANIQLTDVTGKVIRTISMKSRNITINMNGLANGIYLIKYTDADHTQTMKINKQ